MAERPRSRGSGEAETRRFLTFRAGGHLYALPSEEIREVVKLPQLARVPLGPKALLGLGNLRGAVLPVAGLGLLLDRTSDAVSEKSRVIVLEGQTPFGLLVEEVDSFVRVAESRVLAPEATISATDGELLKGVFRAGEDEEPVKILDIRILLAKAFASLERSASSRTAGVSRQSARAAEAAAASEILIAFEVGGQEFALPIVSVIEILPSPRTSTALPHSETAVIGMVGLRDTLLPLLSLRALLGLGGADREGMVIVATIGGAQVGLSVDAVREIIRIDPATLEPVPTVIASRTKGETKVQSVIKAEAGKRLIAVLSPDQLFREDIMTRIRQNAPATVAQPKAANVAERIFIVFTLGDQEYGLAISAVEEVARLPEQVTKLPRSPDFLKGVTNRRGSVLPIVDQRRRFELPDGENGDARRLVVVRIDSSVAGFIVDGVSEVLRVPESSIAPPPDVVEGTRVLEGVLNLEQSGRMILLLDPSQLLTRTEKGLLDALGKVDEAQSAIDQSAGR